MMTYNNELTECRVPTMVRNFGKGQNSNSSPKFGQKRVRNLGGKLEYLDFHPDPLASSPDFLLSSLKKHVDCLSERYLECWG